MAEKQKNEIRQRNSTAGNCDVLRELPNKTVSHDRTGAANNIKNPQRAAEPASKQLDYSSAQLHAQKNIESQ